MSIKKAPANIVRARVAVVRIAVFIGAAGEGFKDVPFNTAAGIIHVPFNTATAGAGFIHVPFNTAAAGAGFIHVSFNTAAGEE